MIEHLTGKAREKFSHWSSRTHKLLCSDVWNGYEAEWYDHVQNLPESAQFGLIQEWALEEGFWLEVGIDNVGVSNVFWNWYVDIIPLSGGIDGRLHHHETRQEAQIEAIKKLNEIMKKII